MSSRRRQASDRLTQALIGSSDLSMGDGWIATGVLIEG
jgi:hypothetical protein